MKKLALRIAFALVALATVASSAKADPLNSLSGNYVGPFGPSSGNVITFTAGGISAASPPPQIFTPGTVTVNDLNIGLTGFTNPTGPVAVFGAGGFVITNGGTAAYSYLNVVPPTLNVTGPTSGVLEVIIGAAGPNTTSLDLFPFYRLELTFNGIAVTNGNYNVPLNGTSSGSFTLTAVGGPDGGPLDPVPEPASIAIWSILILAVAGGFWWRKRAWSLKEVCVAA